MKIGSHGFARLRDRLSIVPSANQRRLATTKSAGYNRLRVPLWGLVFILGVVLFIGISSARAAFVTTNEAGLDGVFSQGSFSTTPDANPIDIFFNPTVTFSNGSLLNINTPERLNTLFSFNVGAASNVVSIYFVDTISWCDGPNPDIIGCASFPGNDIVVESVAAAALGVFGTELLGHELGHNLNLNHDFGLDPNLMSTSLNGNTDLTSAQVTALLMSALVQGSGSSRFISVTPVLITPLPPTVIMFVSALLVLFGIHRRKKALT